MNGETVLPAVISQNRRRTREEMLTAGFPSPANDYAERPLGLDELLVQHPAATFYMRVEGDLFGDAGVNDGDILVVDRALEAGDGEIIVGVIGGEFVIRRLRRHGRQRFFVLAEDDPAPLLLRTDDDFAIWGVVTASIRRFR